MLNLLWICEFRFKCSMSSLAVVFFLRPFLWGILAFRIVETVCKPITLFHSKWETKLRYQGQLNHPTPRMTKKLLCCILPHVPWAPLHPTISPSLKRKRNAILSFYLRWFVIFQWLLHRTSLHKQAYISIFIHYCVCCNTYGTGGYMAIIHAVRKSGFEKVLSLTSAGLTLVVKTMVGHVTTF